MPEKVMLNGLGVHFSQNCGVTLGERTMTEEGFAPADAKRDNRSRL